MEKDVDVHETIIMEKDVAARQTIVAEPPRASSLVVTRSAVPVQTLARVWTHMTDGCPGGGRLGILA
jgi:hypothetical protein